MEYIISDDFQTNLTINKNGEKVEIPITISYYVLDELQDRLQKIILENVNMSKIDVKNIQKTGKLSNADMTAIDMSKIDENVILGDLVYEINKTEIDKNMKKIDAKFNSDKIKKERFIKNLGRQTSTFLNEKKGDQEGK